jgi:hypothetical protein
MREFASIDSGWEVARKWCRYSDPHSLQNCTYTLIYCVEKILVTSIYIVLSGSESKCRTIYILYPVISQEARDPYAIVQGRIQTLLPTKTVQFGPPGSRLFYIEHDHHLDLTRAADVRILKVSINKSDKLFPHRYFRGYWTGNLLRVGCYVGEWRSMIAGIPILCILRLQTQSDGP